MKRILGFLFQKISVFLLLPLLAGFTPLNAQNDTARPAGEQPVFTFVQLTDPHLRSENGGSFLKQAIDDINERSPRPEFVVVTGDLIDGPKHDDLYEAFEKWTDDLHPPLIPVPGETDHIKSFKNTFQSVNISLHHSPFHLLFVSTVDPSADSTNGVGFSDQTVQWMKQALQDVNKSIPLLLFSHAPVVRPQSTQGNLPGNVKNYRSVIDLLEPYDVRAWFAGHLHTNADVRKKDTRVITTASINEEQNASEEPGYRIVNVYEDGIETSFRPIQEFTNVLRVTQDESGTYNGTTAAPIKQAVENAGDGDVIFIGPGTYTFRREIQLKSNLTFAGTADTLLRIPSPALSSTDVSKNSQTVRVEAADPFREGDEIQIRPPEDQDTFPNSEKKKLTKTISSINNQRLTFNQSLSVALPAKSRLGYDNNIFQRRGKAMENIEFRNLNFDGGMTGEIPDLYGHVDRCAILFSAKYTYQDGPQGPPNRNIRVIDCDFRNFYGRPVAFYSAVDCLVENCTMENINDEAINFDHFTFRCKAIGNTIRDSKIGVTINDGSYNVVRHNRFSGCGKAVNLWWWHKCPQKNINIRNKIHQNVIRSPRYGVAIRVSRKAYWNKITGNTVEGEIKVKEKENTIYNNKRK